MIEPVFAQRASSVALRHARRVGEYVLDLHPTVGSDPVVGNRSFVEQLHQMGPRDVQEVGRFLRSELPAVRDQLQREAGRHPLGHQLQHLQERGRDLNLLAMRTDQPRTFPLTLHDLVELADKLADM